MRFLDTSCIRTFLDERLLSSDGVELSVDLYLPPKQGRYPILLNRTPAGNNRAGRGGISPSDSTRGAGADAFMPPAERWKAIAAHGFIVAVADVRGRGDSEGTFAPFVHEAEDGAATLAWLRTLPESNGRIGVFGSGYAAFCAWAAAVADGNVNAIVSMSPFGRVGQGLLHRGGAVRLDWLFWMHLIGGRTLQSASIPPWSKVLKHLPLRCLDEALGREDIWWRDWLSHLDPDDSYWAPLDLFERIAALDVPGLHITGWWDGQSNDAHYYHEAASRGGAPQRLIIGPWDTAAVRRPVQRVGGFDFGPRAALDMLKLLVEFFDEHLRGRQVETSSQVFVTGRNEWTACNRLPSNAAELLTLHLSSTDGANTRCGDGMLVPARPAQRAIDRVNHNPMMPVEFQPLFVSFAAGANPRGLVLDQAHVTARDEALVYTSAPMQEPLTIVGRPSVSLTMCTFAPDADVYVLLSDCFPFGMRDLHLSHGAVRLATLESFAPGKRVRVDLQLDMIAHDFLPGHCVRLTLVPSLFPLYARNMHTLDYLGSCAPAIADIAFHLGSNATACVRLPLAPASVRFDMKAERAAS